MQSEWLTYLAETRPDLYAQAKVEVEWACKWRDDKIVALTAEGEGCKGYYEETMDGREFDCEYEFAGEITCDHCKYGPDLDGYDPSKPMDEQATEGEKGEDDHICDTCTFVNEDFHDMCVYCHGNDKWQRGDPTTKPEGEV